MADAAARGRLITLEGGEGAGKSTQARHLAAWLKARSVDCVLTREPGGSPGAEAIRNLLVTGEPGRWDAVTEAMLMNAARRDHVIRTIRPALASGQWVICDRFIDSTLAYQGYAGGVPFASLEALIAATVEDTRPDLTLVLDLSPETGLARTLRGKDGTEARFERKGSVFHAAVRDGFLRIAAGDPGRCVVIDAGTLPEDRIAQAIAAAVSERLGVSA
ncbi:dTMP kinase [Thalassobaculum sp.]|uniref:dTMP kinase n=1 Tax=Thalassobaculum sp. TaxID=2022740 RepID=UPI0032EE8C4C